MTKEELESKIMRLQEQLNSAVHREEVFKGRSGMKQISGGGQKRTVRSIEQRQMRED